MNHKGIISPRDEPGAADRQRVRLLAEGVPVEDAGMDAHFNGGGGEEWTWLFLDGFRRLCTYRSNDYMALPSHFECFPHCNAIRYNAVEDHRRSALRAHFTTFILPDQLNQKEITIENVVSVSNFMPKTQNARF